MATSSLISLNRGNGANPAYITTSSFPTYSGNIVSALSSGTVCEPWFDKTHKQLWVDKQVLNPKFISDSRPDHTGLEIGNVVWDSTHGATITLGINHSILPTVPSANELITGTTNGTTYTEIARYNPHSSTVASPNSPLNSIYFGQGLSYSVVNGIGTLSCDILDSFVKEATFTSPNLILKLNRAAVPDGQGGYTDTLTVNLGTLLDDTHAPAYGKVQTGNENVATAVTGNTGIIGATIANEKFTLKGGNKWINAAAAPDSATPDSDYISIGHSLSGVTAGTYGTASKVPQVTVDEAGHVTNVTEVTINAGIASDTQRLNGNVGNQYSSSDPHFVSNSYKTAQWQLKTGTTVIDQVNLEHDATDSTYGTGSIVEFTLTPRSGSSVIDTITMYVTRIDGGTF